MDTVSIGTVRLPWQSLREAVTADDTAITVFKASNMPAVGSTPSSGQNGSINLDSPVFKNSSGILIAAWGAGGDAAACTGYKLYGIAKNLPGQEGPIILLAGGVMTLGPMVCSVHPLTGAVLTSNTWVDTITVTDGILSSLASKLDSGNDRICLLKLDSMIFDKVFMEYDEDAAGITAFNAIICGW